ncbi:unnamed protein product, partial [Hapterophycus canaliculatus]
LATASTLIRDETSVRWFPEYGAALLAVGSSSTQDGPIVRRHLYIVGLDNWSFRPHWTHPPR